MDDDPPDLEDMSDTSAVTGGNVTLRAMVSDNMAVASVHAAYRFGDEAAGLLPAAATEVLVHEEGFDPDGRPAAGVVLRWTTPAGGGGVAGEGRAT